MKTDLARPPTRYRNEAVFRSAERLIASTPKKAARKFPRWLVFTAGLSVGIGATIVVMRSRTGAVPTHTDAPGQEGIRPISASVAPFLAEGILRAHLMSGTAAPVSVEFTIRQVADGAGNKLTGVVRYLNRNDSVAEHRLEGEIQNHTLMLRETTRLWSVKASALPIGRTFELRLPEDPALLNRRFGGTWSFGAQGGTLTAVVATPW